MILSHIRRITRDGCWIPEIDGLRFVAIFSVILFHVAGEVMTRSGREIIPEPRYHILIGVIGNGNRGVQLFFVISGMILAMPFARQFLQGAKRVALKKYYMRRLTRLEPPYIASILLILVLTLAYTQHLAKGITAHTLATIFYQHSLIYGTFSTVLPISWSLEVEVQFYLIAPLMMLLLRIPRRWPRRLTIIALVLNIGFAQGLLIGYNRASLSILANLQYFLTGILLADIFVMDLAEMRSSMMWDLAGTLALACIFYVPFSLATRILLPIPFAILILAALRSYWLRKFFANPWIAVTGGMCYSIYLLHYLFIAAFFKLTRQLVSPHLDFLSNYLIQFAVLVVPVVAACTIFYLLIERPCMDPNWPSKLWRWLIHRQQSQPTTSA